MPTKKKPPEPSQHIYSFDCSSLLHYYSACQLLYEAEHFLCVRPGHFIRVLRFYPPKAQQFHVEGRYNGWVNVTRRLGRFLGLFVYALDHPSNPILKGARAATPRKRGIIGSGRGVV